MEKYYRKRYELFSKFDEGIKIAEEQWFSITPEEVARVTAVQIRNRFPSCDRILDPFGGAAGNSVQFALHFDSVVYNEIDSTVASDAKHNAQIYGVDSAIEFHTGDFFDLDPAKIKNIDLVFLSPPWGGPSYREVQTWDVELCNFSAIVRKAQQFAQNFCAFLPRTSDMNQLSQIAGNGGADIEYLYSKGHCVGLCVYWGADLVSNSYTR